MLSRERPTLARRSLLAGLATLPAAAAVAVPAVVAAADLKPDASPEVEELSRLFDAAQKRTAAALKAANAADRRYRQPAFPETLFQRPDEPLHRYVHAVRGPGGRFWYGSPDRIEQLREWPMNLPGWERQYARRAEILQAYEGWEAAIKAAKDAAGVTAADAEYSAAWDDEEKPIRLRIIALRSSDPAALRLKVRAFVSVIAHNDPRQGLEDNIADAIEREGGPWEDAMAASIMRDIVTAYLPASA